MPLWSNTVRLRNNTSREEDAPPIADARRHAAPPKIGFVLGFKADARSHLQRHRKPTHTNLSEIAVTVVVSSSTVIEERQSRNWARSAGSEGAECVRPVSAGSAKARGGKRSR